MDVREKLVELMIEAKKADTEDAPFSEFLADFMIANGVTVQERISVTERLSDKNTAHIKKGCASMNNADKIRSMSDEELAEEIYKGISSDPCDYCKHNNLNCNGSICKGKSDVETIIEWLQQPAEGE